MKLSKTENALPARISVSLLFLMNGFLIGQWAPQIPEFAQRHGLDEGQMGVMIALFGLGALTFMPITGIAVVRFGMAICTRVTSILAVPVFLWLVLADNLALAAIIVFFLGATISSMDVAMNAMAVDVERTFQTPIMSSCHGFWSLGGLIGSLSGGYAIETIDSTGQGLLAFAVAAIALSFAWKWIIDYQPKAKDGKTPIRLPKSWLPYLIGLAALMTAIPEGAVIDWSAFYLRQEIGISTFGSALAFAAFSGAMALVRFLGDPIRKHYGAVLTFRVSALAGAAGLLLSGFSSSPALIIAGFAIAGLGLANMIPIAFSAAGNLPGVPTGIGLSMATTIGYSGVLVAPAFLGHVAEITGFAYLFAGLGVIVLLSVALSPITRYADFEE